MPRAAFGGGEIARTALCGWRTGLAAALCVVLILAVPAGASAEPIVTILHSFAGSPSDGAYPQGDLIADSAGNLFGTTRGGGVPGCGGSGCGTLFKLAPDGTKTVLHAFAGMPSDGAEPYAGLISDSAGTLYGTTRHGGGSGCSLDGCGTLFKLARDGTFSVLHAFSSLPPDGARSFAGLVADRSGTLYGTTLEGGATGCGGATRCGTLFKLAPSGAGFTVRRSFSHDSGSLPEAGLIVDAAGTLYGTTGYGGGLAKAGVVFKQVPGGGYTTLYAFCKDPPTCSDGKHPAASLVADNAGNLYGTTMIGGAANGGTVFTLMPNGTYQVLHSFCSATACSDGASPVAGLLSDAAGNLYGTTQYGGAANNGVAFKLAANGTGFTVLHSFAGGTGDGSHPFGGLIADNSGNLYGTTKDGGASGRGIVYKLAGTGFVTPQPFASFQAKLAMQFGATPRTDAFQTSSAISLATTSNGLNPPLERLTLQIGTFTTILLPGSLKGPATGPFNFSGLVDGVSLQIRIVRSSGLRYVFYATATGASLTGTQNPVPMVLTLGDDRGSISVTATSN